jgi:isocitrate dehydrogenase (NAD+)
MKHSVTLIPGDGIGPQITSIMQDVLSTLGVDIAWDVQWAGLSAVDRCGQVLPEETLASLRKNKIGIKGPTSTPIGGGHQSVNVQLRQKLDLYACIRPVWNIPGVESIHKEVDLVIFRENTEGLYGGLEQKFAPNLVVSFKVVTEKNTQRIARAAFEYARKHARKKVTIVHKANILKLGDGLFLKTAQQVAKDYPDILCDDMIIDATCMRLVQKPQKFDIILAENLYGDILSDLCSGLVGGLGVSPGVNWGEHCVLFESVHGAAPDIAGKDLANPTALLQTAVLMLKHLNEQTAATRLYRGLCKVLSQPEMRTADLGGHATTSQFQKALLAEVQLSFND